MNSSALLPPFLLIARVGVGALFVYEAVGQIAKGWLGGDGLRNMLASALDDNAIPGPYRSFLENVVLEHAGLFTPLVIVGEVAVGTALILGLATRLTALTALFMNANFFIMNGVSTAGASVDAVVIVLEVVIVVFAPRQPLSVDAVLARRGIQSWWLSGAVAETVPRASQPRRAPG